MAGQWAVFDTATGLIETEMPEPDLATYKQEIIGTDANGGPLLSATYTVTWRYGADVDADAGILTRAQYGFLRAAIAADATIILRTKDDAVTPAWVKVRGRSVDLKPGVTFVDNLALGVYLVVNDCEVI